MNPTLIQSASNGSAGPSTSLAVTLGSNTTSHNALLVAIETGSSSNTITSVTDSLSSPYIALGDYADATTGQRLFLYATTNITGGANTVTVNFGQSVSTNIIVLEYSNLATANASLLDAVTSGDNANSTTITSSSLVTTASNDLILALIGNNTASITYSLGSGYQNLVTRTTGNRHIATEDKILINAGSTTASFGQSGAGAQAGIVVFALFAAIPLTTSDTITTVESSTSYSDTMFTRESYQVVISGVANPSISISDTITLSESIKLDLSYTINTSDTITTSENLVLLRQSFITASDQIVLTENFVLLSIANRSTSDTVSMAENITLLITSLFITTSDSITLAESLVTSGTPLIAQSDTLTMTEATQIQGIVSITVVDAMAITDVPSFPGIPSSVSDIASLSESLAHYSDQVDIMESIVVAIARPDISTLDTITLTESVNLLLVAFAAVSDTVTVTESLTVAKIYDVVVNDAATLTESVKLLDEKNINVSDPLSFSETADVIKALGRDIVIVDNRLLDENGNFILDENGNYITDENPSEFLFTSESVNITKVFNVAVSDTVIITEAISIIYSIPGIIVNDTTTLSESVSSLITSRISVSDSITSSESIKLLNQENISVSDNLAFTETTARLIPTLFITMSDGLVINEAMLATTGPGISILESLVVTDSPTVYINIAIVVSDSITISEALSLTKVSDVRVSDTANLSENVQLLRSSFVTVSDLLSTSESSSVLVNAAASDLIAISELLTISESTNVALTSGILATDTISTNESVIVLYATLTITVNDTITLVESHIITGRSFVPRLTLLGIG